MVGKKVQKWMDLVDGSKKEEKNILLLPTNTRIKVVSRTAGWRAVPRRSSGFSLKQNFKVLSLGMLCVKLLVYTTSGNYSQMIAAEVRVKHVKG